MVVKILLPWVTLSATNTPIANHWLDLQQHGETFREKSFNFWKISRVPNPQAGKGLKAFKLVKTLNSLKAKTKKEGGNELVT